MEPNLQNPYKSFYNNSSTNNSNNNSSNSNSNNNSGINGNSGTINGGVGNTTDSNNDKSNHTTYSSSRLPNPSQIDNEQKNNQSGKIWDAPSTKFRDDSIPDTFDLIMNGQMQGYCVRTSENIYVCFKNNNDKKNAMSHFKSVIQRCDNEIKKSKDYLHSQLKLIESG